MMAQSTQNTAGYQALGDSLLTPQELLNIRQHLMGKGLAGFQEWTMLLTEFNCINWDITVFSPNGEIEGIGFTLLRKADSSPVNVIMWQLDDLPMLCPVKHILAWIYMTGISSGYFQIKATCIACIPYQTGLFGTHCMRKTGYLLAYWGRGEDSDVFKCASHKTASMGANYKRNALSLMAIANARSGNDGEIKAPKFKPILSKTFNLRAFIDSVALKFINHNCKVSVDNPIVTPIYISKVILNASRTTTLRQELDQLLSALSAMDAPFAAKFSGVISRLLTEAWDQNTEVEPIVIQFDHEEEEGVGEDGVGKDVNQMDAATISHDLGHAAVGSVQNTREQQANASNSNTDASGIDLPNSTPHSVESNPTPSAQLEMPTISTTSQAHISNKRTIVRTRTIIVQRTASPPSVQPTVSLPLKRKQGGESDLEERSAVKGLKGAAKVQKISKILGSAPSDSNLTNGARLFVNQCHPIVGCLQNHFSGDMEAFIQHHVTISTSSFKSSKCLGKDDKACRQL
ncbi:hypothetical protein CcCBS67573_g05975 [Chytriomyces confervae]|uniref:Uncharacterized protein n=1 Tax=Chytriomyces confervae TaxID=246404 RepID=A0A507F9Q3_9FUNG|nr:hypothetical protein CcCBS67573_g05975 [Chytriomyces confervae]